jgi:hypothetical protein
VVHDQLLRDLRRANHYTVPVTSPPRLFEKMKLPSLLALNGSDRAIRHFPFGITVKGYLDGKPPGLVASKNLNARDRLATRPLPESLKALFPKSPVP